MAVIGLIAAAWSLRSDASAAKMTVERGLSEPFTVQREVARAIAQEVRGLK